MASKNSKPEMDLSCPSHPSDVMGVAIVVGYMHGVHTLNTDYIHRLHTCMESNTKFMTLGLKSFLNIVSSITRLDADRTSEADFLSKPPRILLRIF